MSLMRRLKEKRLKEWGYTSEEREVYNRAISMRDEEMLERLKCHCDKRACFKGGFVAGAKCPRCQMIELREKVDRLFPEFVEKERHRKEKVLRIS